MLVLPKDRRSILDLHQLLLKALDPHLVRQSKITAIQGIHHLAGNI